MSISGDLKFLGRQFEYCYSIHNSMSSMSPFKIEFVIFLVLEMRILMFQSKKWYIRVRVGNLKGFGPPVTPEPPYIVPSCKLVCFVKVRLL